MRGCAGSSVVESSAICARSAPCRSRSRWISCELSTSSDASSAPPSVEQRLRPSSRARFGLGARRPRARQLGVDVAELLRREVAAVRAALLDVEEAVASAR